MFSKNNVYMFPHGPLSSPHPPNSAANEIFLHHHDMLSGHYSGGGEPFAAANPCASAKASKKDRHSKIYTAQGPRDRRVRLSIGVARKFFDLQESLGFDKPSKTLDWLLTKSKADINDLVEMRGKKGSSDAAASECEVDSAEALDLKKKEVVTNSAEKLKGSAKESRVKARARARERTREKMSIKKLNNINYELNPIQLMNNQLKISGGSNTSNINLGIREAMLYESAAINDQDLIQESIVIKRKLKHHPSSILGFQQNLIISSSNYGVVPSPYTATAENWDISTILDQHKFMNG